jgi:hypothetical protein
MTDLSALRGLRGAIPRVVLVARYVGGDRQDPIAFWIGSDRTEGVALRCSSDPVGVGLTFESGSPLFIFNWGDELRISSEPGNELAEASHVAI